MNIGRTYRKTKMRWNNTKEAYPERIKVLRIAFVLIIISLIFLIIAAIYNANYKTETEVFTTEINLMKTYTNRRTTKIGNTNSYHTKDYYVIYVNNYSIPVYIDSKSYKSLSVGDTIKVEKKVKLNKKTGEIIATDYSYIERK